MKEESLAVLFTVICIFFLFMVLMNKIFKE